MEGKLVDMIQDLHIHTIYSDGVDTIDNILQKATKNNIEVGISDHILCKKMPTKKNVFRYFETLDNYPVLKGGEIDLGETGIIDDLIISKADYIIGSIHSVRFNDNYIKLGKYFDDRDSKKILNSNFVYDDYLCCCALEKILKTIENELSQNYIDILGHCTVNPFYEQVNSKFRYEWENELISICKLSNTAIEISGLWIEPGADFVQKALNKHVKVTFGSDCHTKYSTEYLDYFHFISKSVNLKEGDVLKIAKE